MFCSLAYSVRVFINRIKIIYEKMRGKTAMEEARRKVKIINTLGLHARPASLFVKVATNFKSEIIVEKDGEEVNGKSLMGLLMLAAASGSEINISAKGEDCVNALQAIVDLIERKFEEE
jgi:phosphocarrier protein HPr